MFVKAVFDSLYFKKQKHKAVYWDFEPMHVV